MANITPMFFTLLFFILSGDVFRAAKGQALNQGAWCVAKPSSSDVELQNNINFACNNIGNCNLIQAGGPCFDPQTLINHASVAMNLYYQKQGRNYWNCDFNKSAIISVSDPSYGACKYENGQ